LVDPISFEAIYTLISSAMTIPRLVPSSVNRGSHTFAPSPNAKIKDVHDIERAGDRISGLASLFLHHGVVENSSALLGQLFIMVKGARKIQKNYLSRVFSQIP
jgi:hypothetical protein